MGGGKGGSSSRALSQEETDLFAQQTKSLARADEIAVNQFDLSKSDREYFNQIFRGEANPNDPIVSAAISKALEEAQASKTASGYKVPSINKDEFIAKYIADDTTNSRNYYSGGANKTPAQLRAEGEKAYKGVSATLPMVSALLSDAESDAVRSQILEKFKTGQSVDELLFDAVKGSKSELSVALTSYADKSAAISSQFGTERSGIANKYTAQMENLAGEFNAKMKYATSDFISKSEGALGKFDSNTNTYQSAFETVAGNVANKLGTADTDILSQQRGQQLAGISQAYREAQNELLGTLSRRGLAGSGVEAQGLTNLAQQQAQQQAGALSQSYNQSIGLSDQRRLQQYGIAGDVAQQGIGLQGQQLQGALGVAQGNLGARGGEAQASFGVGSQVAQTGYNANMANVQAAEATAQQQAAMQYQGTTGNVQQNLSNLNLASGVSQGIYGGASNMLAGAGQTSNQSAQIAGTTGVAIGNTNQAYMQAQQEASSSGMAGVASLVGTIGAAYMTGGASLAVQAAAAK